MAYMNQDRKAQIALKVKPILAKYGLKGTLSVRNHMTVVLTLTQGAVDFIGDMKEQLPHYGSMQVIDKAKMRERYELDVNIYHYDSTYTGAAHGFLSEVIPALRGADWYDRSDIMTDYFDTAYYVDVRVGTWKKPYKLAA